MNKMTIKHKMQGNRLFDRRLMYSSINWRGLWSVDVEYSQLLQGLWSISKGLQVILVLFKTYRLDLETKEFDITCLFTTPS